MRRAADAAPDRQLLAKSRDGPARGEAKREVVVDGEQRRRGAAEAPGVPRIPDRIERPVFARRGNGGNRNRFPHDRAVGGSVRDIAHEERDPPIGTCGQIADDAAHVASHPAFVRQQIERVDADAHQPPLVRVSRTAASEIALKRPCEIIDDASDPDRK